MEYLSQFDKLVRSSFIHLSQTGESGFTLEVVNSLLDIKPDNQDPNNLNSQEQPEQQQSEQQQQQPEQQQQSEQKSEESNTKNDNKDKQTKQEQEEQEKQKQLQQHQYDRPEGEFSFFYYPDSPFVLTISRTLLVWGTEKCFPMKFPPMPLLIQTEDIQSIVDSHTEQVSETVSYVINLIKEQEGEGEENKNNLVHNNRLTSLLSTLTFGGILIMLGMRRTTGSVLTSLPPPRSKLIESFEARHTNVKGNILTVGARAFSKHCHRSLGGWWGVVKGSEANQNQHARDTLKKIINNAQWRNLHLLPHQLATFEIRNELGYGARWSADGTSFRGFLEPPMEGGHEKGWRHE